MFITTKVVKVEKEEWVLREKKLRQKVKLLKFLRGKKIHSKMKCSVQRYCGGMNE